MKNSPTVSIVLPTYNRADFLPQAFHSIASQTFTDWELIVVDDGSTDDTENVVGQLAAQSPGTVRYHRQFNQGPAGARNTGALLANGNYIAFFDSDDLWLPHHLADCVVNLKANTQVHWVCSSLRIIDARDNRVLDQDTFRVKGVKRSFFRQRHKGSGHLLIIHDPDFARCMIEEGGVGNLQASVIRREVFDQVQLPSFRVGEDQVFMVQFLKAGFVFAYIDDVHVVYRVHGEQVSAAGGQGDINKRLKVYQELSASLEALPHLCDLSAEESRALSRRLSKEYFWNMGFSLLWKNGRHTEALGCYEQAIKLWPWNLHYWKTYLLAKTRVALGQRRVPFSHCCDRIAQAIGIR